MADNVAITAGAGTNIATDDVSSVHYQKIKVFMGGDGVEGDVWDGVLRAGTAGIGKLTANSGVDIGDVDVTSLPGTVESDIGAIKTAVEIIDNIVSGSEAQVDVVAALPAGTNAIGKLAANSGVDIGDVDVTSLPDVSKARTDLTGTSGSKTTITTGASSTSSGQDVSDAIGLLITISVDFGASPDADTKVEIQSSPDNSNWDTVPFAQMSVAEETSTTKQKTIRIGAEPKYIRTKTTNNDSADSVDVWVSMIKVTK